MSSKKRAENWPAEQKLKTVQEYDSLPDEEAQGRFLRERGHEALELLIGDIGCGRTLRLHLRGERG
jgi:hypothetical protein